MTRSVERFPNKGKFTYMSFLHRGPDNIPCIIKRVGTVQEFLNELHYFTKRRIDRIEMRTRGQSNNAWWHIYRRGCISGTIVKRVISQNQKDCSNAKLNQSISKTGTQRFTNLAMEYGIQNESYGIKTFLKMYRSSHKTLKVEPIGLVINENLPYLAGSPDGYVTCSCCSPALIEIKSPYRLRNCGISGWRLLDDYLDRDQNLKPDHSYRHQINFYLGLKRLHICYLVIYAKGQAIIKTIVFNESLYAYQLRNLSEYYTNFYLPSVIGRRNGRLL